MGGGGLFILQPNLNCPMAGVRDVSASQLSLPKFRRVCKVLLLLLNVSGGIVLALAILLKCAILLYSMLYVVAYSIKRSSLTPHNYKRPESENNTASFPLFAAIPSFSDLGPG